MVLHEYFAENFFSKIGFDYVYYKGALGKSGLKNAFTLSVKGEPLLLPTKYKL